MEQFSLTLGPQEVVLDLSQGKQAHFIYLFI